MMSRKMQDRLAGFEPRFSPMAYKAALFGMLIAAFAIPLGLAAIPYIEFFNDMAVQPKGKAQGLYGTTIGQPHLVDRMPPSGSLPMDFMPYAIAGNDVKAAERAGETLRNPLKPTMKVLERGQKLFHDYCRTCHGSQGQGDGPIVGPGLFPAPPSLHTDTARSFKDGRIFHVITRGQNAMPSYADKLNTEDRWAVIHFLRALQRSLHPTPEDLKE